MIAWDRFFGGWRPMTVRHRRRRRSGSKRSSSIVSGDATQIATEMVTRYGMNETVGQRMFFKASRTDGKPPIGGKGVLFPSLKAVTNNFAKFAELLNVRAIIDRRHLAHLNEAEGLVITDAEQQFFARPARTDRRTNVLGVEDGFEAHHAADFEITAKERADELRLLGLGKAAKSRCWLRRLHG